MAEDYDPCENRQIANDSIIRMGVRLSKLPRVLGDAQPHSHLNARLHVLRSGTSRLPHDRHR
jgi:hypothetical protein